MWQFVTVTIGNEYTLRSYDLNAQVCSKILSGNHEKGLSTTGGSVQVEQGPTQEDDTIHQLN